MKFFAAIILHILLAYTAYLYSSVVPWYGFAIGAFLVGLIVPQKAWRSWLCGFCGVFLCWSALAWYMDSLNNSLFATKMAFVFPLGGSALLLIFVSALVGALVGGFAALTGAYLRYR